MVKALCCRKIVCEVLKNDVEMSRFLIIRLFGCKLAIKVTKNQNHHHHLAVYLYRTSLLTHHSILYIYHNSIITAC